MKRYTPHTLAIVGSCLLLAFGLSTITQAAVTEQMINVLDPVALPQTDEAGEEALIGQIISFFLSIFGILFLGLMIYGGYTYMKAQGREEEVEKGKKIIQAAVIGMVIAFLAYSITFFILSRLPGASSIGEAPAAEEGA